MDMCALSITCVCICTCISVSVCLVFIYVQVCALCIKVFGFIHVRACLRVYMHACLCVCSHALPSCMLFVCIGAYVCVPVCAGMFVRDVFLCVCSLRAVHVSCVPVLDYNAQP